MDATALRASTQAVTPQGTSSAAAAAATTNGPSSGMPVAGGGPVPAPSQPTLLGVTLLPAPAGTPQPIHLTDGSTLVPFARVDARGNRLPLTGGGALAAPAAAAPAPAPVAPATAATPVTGGGAFEPKGFLYNDRYFKKFQDASAIDLADVKAVEERATKATMAHLLEDEPDVHDFGVTNVTIRRADPVADSDLMRINPRSLYVIDVEGVTGTGLPKSVPSVMNSDGAVFVDPRIGKG